MEVRATWRPYNGDPHASRAELPDSAFAFPHERAEPLTDAAHVRSAIARFDQVKGASDADRDVAFRNIQKAANYYDVAVAAKSWRDIGRSDAEDVVERSSSSRA